ncbi:hypothetical protein B566_EDAN012004 [Ephemera danica]|nr:hypothetical protein B566_EDAN012004 [Ephemera danica]
MLPPNVLSKHQNWKLHQFPKAQTQSSEEVSQDGKSDKTQAAARTSKSKKRVTVVTEYKSNPITALQLYQAATRLLLVLKLKRDKERFEKLCSLLVESLTLDSVRYSYVGVALSREHAIPWIAHIKKLLWRSCLYLDQLSPDIGPDARSLLLHLRVLRLLLKGLCGPKVLLQNIALSAIINLAIRPLASAGYSNKLLSLFLIHILSVPALIYHLNSITPESIAFLVTHKILPRCIELLSAEQDLRIVFNALEGNYALCLLGNIIQMAHIERDGSLREIYYPAFTSVISTLLASCQRYVTNKQSNLTHWHPVLGWFAQYLDPRLHAAIPTVRTQLAMLWGAPLASILLGDLASIVETAGPPVRTESSDFDPLSFSALRKVFFSDSAKSDKKNSKLGSPDFVKVARMAAIYQTALGTLTQLRLDILTGLCYQNNVLHLLWRYLCTLGPGCGMTMFLDLLQSNPAANCPEFQLLILFCDCMTHYVTILDDIEMYEQQNPFKLEDFVFMSDFLNQFLYRGLLDELFVSTKLGSNPLFQSMHTLLLMLYRRDCIRQYTPKFHWLIRDMSVRAFISELDKGKNAYQKRECNFSVDISRIVEDGYRQLALLPPTSLKGVIRVRFVNEQGLFEAGIDQDGVFKEFLEETVKRVFDPSLNLFRATSEERLYPSPTSSLQDNHLQLFEFVGRMIGKAVYEGIVVDVPFASFFLSQLLGSQHQAFYSAIDELPSLDAELYRSLTYIKHYEGDVGDLELTFSIDQDYLGKVQTFELVPGGRAIPVTNENK